MIYLGKDAMHEEIEALIKDAQEEVDYLREQGHTSNPEYSLHISALEQKLGKIRKKLLVLNDRYFDYGIEYTRYRREYDMLMNSGSIKATMALRRILGRNYQPLFPSWLDQIFDTAKPVWREKALDEHQLKRTENVRRFKEQYPTLIEEIHDSNGSGYYKKSDIRAGIITDDYMYNYYKDALDFEYIHYENYRKQLDTGNFSFVLYVSCWNGLEKDYCGVEGNKKVAEIFDYANAIGITTIFQTIEDPVSYDYYLDIAKRSKVILTSDTAMVDRYKADLGNENVHAIEYGINPKFHNPVDFMRYKGDKSSYLSSMILFAGSWFSIYPERCHDCARIFDGVVEDLDHSLLIIDRQSNLPKEQRKDYVFPVRYQQFSMGAVDHADLQKIHRLFDYSICVNTVKNSDTMCAMRVYELQAQGCLMLSNYALVISKKFPSIFMISDEDEVSYILNGYTKREIFNMQVDGIRRMYSGSTVYDRLNDIFQYAGIQEKFEEKRIAVILRSGLYENYGLGDEMQSNAVCVFSEEAINESSLYGFDYVIYPSERLLGYRHFIADVVNAFKFVDVDFVRYLDDEDYEESYSYVKGTPSKEDTLFSLDRIEFSSLGDASYLESLNGFTVARSKWGRDTSRQEKELAVIIPIYNNGRYLKDRSFLSLLRSSIFDKMNIYLMDDGSTDLETQKVLADLCSEYDNVFSYRCGDKGSGSASHPRNVALKTCMEPYITFLDPDDEAVSDGYAKLLKAIKSEDVDFAIGDILSIGAPTFNAVKIKPFFDKGVHNDPIKELIENDFDPHNVQSCIFRRDFLAEQSMQFVEGAFGEDSLFYYETMVRACSFLYVDTPIFIYYMERNDSAVNAISKDFFEKSLLTEKAQVAFLKKNNLFEEYKERRLECFMENWYQDKLLYVPADEYEQCKCIIATIAELYN